ncbi:MAG TPA: polysaccharide lyase family 7 protein [Pseudomonas sp.]|nr:polysaccharide lyase family 7 protein [Pseudomonas sp.]
MYISLPRVTRYLRRALLPLALLSLCNPALAELDPNLPPGGNFALDNWNMLLPTDSDGSTNGEPLLIQPYQLSGPTGYSRWPWFFTDTDGAMTIWAPVTGATTGGSRHPRNELRELLAPPSTAVNWDSFGKAKLDAQVRVMQVPRDGIVIVGQVHGYYAAPLVMVYYRFNPITQTGRLMVKLQGSPVQGPPFWQHMIADNIKLGQTFSYQINVERIPGGQALAFVSANNGPYAMMLLDPSWDPKTFYFKAGAYLHTYGSNPLEGALVKFYNLAVSHPANGLAISSATTLPAAKAGAAYRVALQAQGGAGGGTWQLVSGFPPKGLRLDSSGVLSGTPLASAVSAWPNDFTVQIRDAYGSTDAKTLSVMVAP